MFTGPKGAPIRRGNFNPLVKRSDAVQGIGRPGLHFHDLRHTGNTLAAGAGGSTRDLMTRMGHDSMHAALIYQHSTTQADRAIAERLDASGGYSHCGGGRGGRPVRLGDGQEDSA